MTPVGSDSGHAPRRATAAPTSTSRCRPPSVAPGLARAAPAAAPAEPTTGPRRRAQSTAPLDHGVDPDGAAPPRPAAGPDRRRGPAPRARAPVDPAGRPPAAAPRPARRGRRPASACSSCWCGLACLFVLIAGKVADLQVLNPSRYLAYGESQTVRSQTLAAERGTIYDRNHIELAMSVPKKTIFADPKLVDRPRRPRPPQLAPSCGSTPSPQAKLSQQQPTLTGAMGPTASSTWPARSTRRGRQGRRPEPARHQPSSTRPAVATPERHLAQST